MYHKMEDLTSRIVAAYKEMAEIPSLSSATLLPVSSDSVVTVITKWKQTHLSLEENVYFQKVYVVSGDPVKKLIDHPPVDVSSEQLSALTPSGKLRAVLRKVPDKCKDNKQVLEVWRSGNLWKKIDLTELDHHGQVYTDNEFGSFLWSPCETKILYIAEKKQPKSESFFKVKHPKKSTSDDGELTVKGGEYEFREDWGEQMTGKHQPVVVTVNVETEAVSVLEQVPDGYSPGQVVWAPDSQGVVGIAWKNLTQRLGRMYCFNREGAMFHASLDGQYSVLSEGMTYTSPRFSPDGQLLVWLEASASGPHNKGHRLMKCTWVTRNTEVIIDVVPRQMTIDGDSMFFGFYGCLLPARCWSSDSQRLLINSVQEDTVCLFVVNVVTGTLRKIPSSGDITLLDVNEDIIAVEQSTLTVPSHLLMGRLPGTGKEEKINFVAVDGKPSVPGMDKVHCEIMKLLNPDSHSESNYADLPYSALCMWPQDPPEPVDSNHIPLIVMVHGGPHSVFTSSFIAFRCAFLKLGFACLMVNYRGSCGAGDDSINSLLGNVGKTDVQDCHHAVQEALQKYNFFDPDRVVLSGGSHGGFLVTHLIGQYPDFYKAAAVRNPVVNLASLACVSDIPDWSWIECGLHYSLDKVVTPDTLRNLWEHSPVSFVDQVKTPLLLFVGKNDRRVPPSQSYEYYHALKARNVTVSMMTYEDCHPLQKPPVTADFLVKVTLWYFRHLGLYIQVQE